MTLKIFRLIPAILIVFFTMGIGIVSAEIWTFNNEDDFEGWSIAQTYYSVYPDVRITWENCDASGIVILDACTGLYQEIWKEVTIPASSCKLLIHVVKPSGSSYTDGVFFVSIDSSELGTTTIPHGYDDILEYEIPEAFRGSNSVIHLRSVGNGCNGEHIGIDSIEITGSTSPPPTADTTYSYDANGNMVNDGTWTYTYDDTNHLSEVRSASDNSLLAQYFYDAAGNRIKKVSNGITTYYIGDIVESRYQGAEPQETSYYFANGERVARKDPEGSVFYYHGDHLGSTSLTTDDAGNVVESVAYLPYGETQSHSGSSSNFLYTDQELDPETGLYYYGARYYSPQMMRFAEPDPVIHIYNPQSLNPYAYVLNNPLKFSDPTGRDFFEDINKKISSTIEQTTTNIKQVASVVSHAADSLCEQYAPGLAEHNEKMRNMVKENPDKLWNAGAFNIEGVGTVTPGAFAKKMYENPTGFLATIGEGAIDAATLGGGGSVKSAVTTGFKVGVGKETLQQIGNGGSLDPQKIVTSGVEQAAISGSMYFGAEKVVNALPVTERWSNGATRVVIRDEAGRFITHTSADKVSNLLASQAEMTFFTEPYSTIVQNALPRL